MRPILVVGATGLLGSEICRLLCGSQHAVRGLVRPGSPRIEMLRRLGVDLAAGDLRDVRSLEAALRGVTTVISTASGAARRLPGDSLGRVDRDGQRALVDAARRGGARRFVFASLSPHLPRTTPLVRYKRQTEAAVRGSGMAWVIVQPSAFMETWLHRGAGFDVESGRVFVLGSGEAPVSWVSVRDVAQVMAGIANPDSGVSRTFVPVGGPHAITPLEAARIFDQEAGRRSTALRVPVPLARAAGFLTRPFDPALSSALGISARRAMAGDVVLPSELVGRLVPRPVTVWDHARATVRAARTERIPALVAGNGRDAGLC